MYTEQLIVNRIRTVREEKNYTQLYVAYKLGVSQNTFSKIELGHVKLTLARFLAIAIILEVDTRHLLS